MSNNRELADLISQAGGTSEGVLTGRRNLIINGGFDVWQRGTSFSAGGYTADRWIAPSPGTLSVTKSYDSTLGLNYLTNTNSGGWGIITKLEAKGVQHLRAGTAVTFSLYTTVASGDKLYYKANTGTRLAAGLTTIETIGSWYRKSVTITVTSEMETLFDSDQYLELLYESFVGANTPYSITGVQLELGSVATPFEHRSYGEELALCQRYYEIADFYIRGAAPYSGRIGSICNFSVTKRAAPSISFANIAGGGTITGAALGATAGITGVGVASDPLLSTTSGTLRCDVIADAEL